MHTGRVERSSDRAGCALAHLLLVVVLALGVFVMHVVGHPEGSSGSGTESGAMTHTGAAGHRAPDRGPLLAAPGHGAADSGTASASWSASASSSPSSHDSGMARDMSSLCVAVLVVWLLAGLVRAALARRPDRLARLLTGLTPVLGPNAPPRRPPDLSRLSVLRI
ncbi:MULTISPECIES: hypothetical protein [unclassified Streptomyces]|uniref:hypothetical protein n=1 Tax=unclassified Streptomyces TaxID=2593676 RepID=UPI0033BED32C